MYMIYKLCYILNNKLNFFNFRLELKLYKPMVLEKGQRFTLRDGSATVGTGVITNVLKSLTDDERTFLKEGKKGIEKKIKKEQQKRN